MDLKQVEKVSKALGDVTRLKILAKIAACKGSFQCADIRQITDLAQPSVSHHIKTLIEAGLIEAEKDGRSYSYRLNVAVFKAYVSAVSDFAKNTEPLQHS